MKLEDGSPASNYGDLILDFFFMSNVFGRV